MISLLKQLFQQEQIDFASLFDRDALILDVRSPKEFARGHAAGSINIPVQDLPNHLSDLQQQAKPIIVCCRSGARAASAVSSLQSLGVEAYNAWAWQNVEEAQSS